MTINGKYFNCNEDGQKRIDWLVDHGKNARVQYPDGALWLFTYDGHCYKLNDM